MTEQYIYTDDVSIHKMGEIETVKHEPDNNKDKVYDDLIYETERGQKHVNYDRFAKAVIEHMNLISYRGMFFDTDGEVPVEKIRQEIAQTLSDLQWTSKFDSVINSLISTIRDMSNKDDFQPDKNTLYFKNGELDISSDEKWIFHEGLKTHTPYRLNCNFLTDYGEMKNFEKWMKDLFNTDDFQTIQEMLGSSLVPMNKVQEAFILVGGAGCGKSVFTHLLYEIFGKAYVAVNLTELDENKFILANIENKLIVYDDDLQTRALTDTGEFKKLITSEQPIKAERKGQQPYMFTPFATVIANTNQMVQALYDDSEGFFRRLHPIIVKERAEGRRDIYNMNELVTAEKDAVVRWAIQGLWELRQRRYKIHWSDASIDFLEAERNPLKSFFDDVFTVTGLNDDRITTQEITRIYKKWCRGNVTVPVSDKRIVKWLRGNASKLNIESIQIGKTRLHGYKYLTVREEWR